MTTTTAATARLIGHALTAHHAAHGSNGSTTRAETVTRAGYLRPDGRPAFTDYYEALIAARQLAAPHAWHAAANPETWHGPQHSDHAPERFSLLVITNASGEQIGASLPVPAPVNGWSDADTYAEAERLTNTHAAAYAAAAQGPDAFPLSVTIQDRSGSATLFSVDADGDLTDDLADGISRCESCGAIEDTDDGQSVQIRQRNGWGFESEHWCSSCTDEDATRCDDCGDYYANGELNTVHNGDDICPACLENYSTCNDCDEIHPNDDCHTVDDNTTVCRHCIDSGEGSHYHYHEGEGWYTTPLECDDDDEHQGPGMRRYSYHTDANATLGHTIAATGYTYGAEMEYNGSPSNWEAVAAACRNRAILTNDSTVSGEFVSAALTAGQLRKHLAALTAALAGTRNDSETGLHCHVDRRALTPWQWHTLSHYASTYASTLEAIAGRTSNKWANLQRLPAHDWPTFAKQWRNRCWPSRYAGINFSKGPTVEWRICRATKTPARALARFGMIQRLTALGRLAPSQRPQSEAELRGWLAQDQYIQQVTGWEAGTFNYRAALMQPMAQGDQQPTAPTAEAVKLLADKVDTLRADEQLTNRIMLNANRQRTNPDQTYATDATARTAHYAQNLQRIQLLLRQARAQYDQAETLSSIGSLTR